MSVIEPLPSKVLLDEPAAVARPNELELMPGSAVTAALTLPLLSIVLLLDCVAVTFSTMFSQRSSRGARLQMFRSSASLSLPRWIRVACVSASVASRNTSAIPTSPTP